MKNSTVKIFAVSLAIAFALPSLSSCSSEKFGGFKNNVLRIASWDEYIDEGGEDSWVEGSNPMYEEFEEWYNSTHDKKIVVEYIAMQDNETMYNKIKMGETYDLLCPSEYMIMKLKSEGKLLPFSESFFDPSVEENYYIRGQANYIKDVFESCGIDDYAAGYMWGNTGFVYNTDYVEREEALTWQLFRDKNHYHQATAKDNTRDSYFAGLGMYYEDELLALKEALNRGDITLDQYKATLKEKMNDTSPETMAEVKKLLIEMRENLYGLETDEGKDDVAMGRIPISYQWSGDAAYIIECAEEYDVSLEYAIPESASNIWFDGWAMMKGTKNQEAAEAFVNYVSKPINVIRNMYYIGYTSCIVGDEIFEYLQELYEVEEDGVDYDISHFFGGEEGDYVLYVDEAETRGMLYAQYPDKDTFNRLVVMNFFNKDENERANRMWINIK